MQLNRFPRPFILMFLIALLLNVGLTILRSARNTLAVIDLDIGAASIPLFEFCGVLPASVLMTFLLAKLLKKMPLIQVFNWILLSFITFFTLFSLAHPHLAHLQPPSARYPIYMLFYIGCELWKPALINILFMGLLNHNMSPNEARKYYAPLMLGGSIGAILAGPIITLCTSAFSNEWSYALNLLMGAVAIIGLTSIGLYKSIWTHFSTKNHNDNAPSQSLQGITSYLQNPELKLLSWIVIADYIAYSLGEVIFLEALKMRYPDPCDYCNYMGIISSWSGLLTIGCALFITPYLLQKCKWTVAAAITPICLLVTEGAFFLFLRAEEISHYLFHWSHTEWIHAVILLGSLQYCICRTAKYTLFDASKELAYVLIPEKDRMGGKLLIDGICSRIGRGSASLLNLGLITLSGGVLASSLLSGAFALTMGWSWLKTTQRLGKRFEKEETKALV